MPAAGGRMLELDGLRAFAILPVLLLHFSPVRGALAVLRWPFACGWFGVELFFVLSGYLITGLLLKVRGNPGYYRSFISRRALRILPLYYLVLGVVLLATWARPELGRWTALLRWGSPLWFVCYLGNIPVAMRNTVPPVPSLSPLWSLQIEEQYYLLYPTLIALIPPARLRASLVTAIVVALLLRIAVTLAAPSASAACYVLTPLRMDALALGGLLALLQHERQFISRRVLVGVGAIAWLAAITLVVLVSPLKTDPLMRTVGYSVVDLGCTCLLGLVVWYPSRRLGALLRWKPLVSTGRISYGLYLWHFPAAALTLAVARRFIPVEPGDSLALPISILGAYVIATASWFLLERPLLEWRERIRLAGLSAARPVALVEAYRSRQY